MVSLRQLFFSGLMTVGMLGGAALAAHPAPGGEQASPPLKAVTVAKNFKVIWEMAFLPDGRLLVTERGGDLRLVDLKTGSKTKVGDIKVWSQTEAGLMGLALSPTFEKDRFIYLCYSHLEKSGSQNRVSRFRFDGKAISDEKVLLDGMKGQHIHDGCRLGFGPDGLLYITMGDAAKADVAQERDALNGKVLRIAPDGSVPKGNPFATPVFTWGHRNPQGIAWHPETGATWVSEHGPAANDEINLLKAGKNYGWPTVGGLAGDPRFEDALAAWTPTIAPAGIAFYTGTQVPQWKNDLFLVTLKEADLRRLRFRDGKLVFEEILLDGELGRTRAIVMGPDGYLYLGTSNKDGRGRPKKDDDRIVRLEPAP